MKLFPHISTPCLYHILHLLLTESSYCHHFWLSEARRCNNNSNNNDRCIAIIQVTLCWPASSVKHWKILYCRMLLLTALSTYGLEDRSARVLLNSINYIIPVQYLRRHSPKRRQKLKQRSKESIIIIIVKTICTIEKDEICTWSIEFFAGENVNVFDAEVECQPDDLIFRQVSGDVCHQRKVLYKTTTLQ